MFLKFAVATVLACSAAVAGATHVSIQPNAANANDARIATDASGADADANFGHFSYLMLGTEEEAGLIQFDVTPYLGQNAQYAYVRFLGGLGDYAGGTLTLSLNTSAWDQDTVTWNNAPGHGPVVATIPMKGGAEEYQFHIDNVVNDWLQGGANYGLRLERTGGQPGFHPYMTSAEHPFMHPSLFWDTVPPTRPGANVPEPASLSLLAIGLLAAGAMRRRRK